MRCRLCLSPFDADEYLKQWLCSPNCTKHGFWHWNFGAAFRAGVCVRARIFRVLACVTPCAFEVHASEIRTTEYSLCCAWSEEKKIKKAMKHL